MKNKAKKVLIIVNSSPFGTVFPVEALRAGIAFAGMDLDTSLVFSSDGVFSLLKGQNPGIIGAKGIKEGLSNAEEFGLKLFVDRDSLKEKKVSANDIAPVKILSSTEIKNLARSVEVIINF